MQSEIRDGWLIRSHTDRSGIGLEIDGRSPQVVIARSQIVEMVFSLLIGQDDVVDLSFVILCADERPLEGSAVRALHAAGDNAGGRSG